MEFTASNFDFLSLHPFQHCIQQPNVEPGSELCVTSEHTYLVVCRMFSGFKEKCQVHPYNLVYASLILGFQQYTVSPLQTQLDSTNVLQTKYNVLHVQNKLKLIFS